MEMATQSQQEDSSEIVLGIISKRRPRQSFSFQSGVSSAACVFLAIPFKKDAEELERLQ